MSEIQRYELDYGNEDEGPYMRKDSIGDYYRVDDCDKFLTEKDRQINELTLENEMSRIAVLRGEIKLLAALHVLALQPPAEAKTEEGKDQP